MSLRVDETKTDEEKIPWYYNLFKTIRDAPINLTLLLVSAFVFYKVVYITRNQCKEPRKIHDFQIIAKCQKDELPSIRRDFTIKQLREYDGSRDDGRILLAVNRNVYDVSSAVHFYGKDGAYPHYAGSDISRDLINLSKSDRDQFDDLSDLTEAQIGALLKWDKQYGEKYPLVGILVAEYDEEITNYIQYENDNENENENDLIA